MKQAIFYILGRSVSFLIFSNSNLIGKKFKHKQIIFQTNLYIDFICTYGCLDKNIYLNAITIF